MPSTPSRLLNWEACINTRDLGGYPLQGGGETRWQALVRSDSSALLTPAGQKALVAYGIRTVIDLRFADELVESPSPFARAQIDKPEEWPDYIHIPLDEDQDLVWPTPLSPAEAMRDLYVRVLEKNRRFVAAVLTTVARARPGGVLFHCHAGKDRTGLIAALILGLSGVPNEIIAADYAFTHPALEELRRSRLDNPSFSQEELGYWSTLSSALPETMQLVLETLEERYGGVKGYLETTALLPGSLDFLQERLFPR